MVLGNELVPPVREGEAVVGPLVQVLIEGEAQERVLGFGDLAIEDDDPATISDADLIARVERYYDMDPGALGGYKVSRPQTGNIVVLNEPVYG